MKALLTLISLAALSQALGAPPLEQGTVGSQVEQVRGKILDITRTPLCTQLGCKQGFVVTLTNDEKSKINVYMGTEWNPDANLPLKKGETVTALGVRIEFKGMAGYLARQLNYAEKKVRLPENPGYPTWFPNPHP